MNRLRIRVIHPSKTIEDEWYMMIAMQKIAGIIVQQPCILECLDDESGSWVPVPIETAEYYSAMVALEAGNLREMPS